MRRYIETVQNVIANSTLNQFKSNCVLDANGGAHSETYWNVQIIINSQRNLPIGWIWTTTYYARRAFGTWFCGISFPHEVKWVSHGALSFVIGSFAQAAGRSQLWSRISIRIGQDHDRKGPSDTGNKFVTELWHCLVLYRHPNVT